jgi:hypothetical protein
MDLVQTLKVTEKGFDVPSVRPHPLCLPSLGAGLGEFFHHSRVSA